MSSLDLHYRTCTLATAGCKDNTFTESIYTYITPNFSSLITLGTRSMTWALPRSICTASGGCIAVVTVGAWQKSRMEFRDDCGGGKGSVAGNTANRGDHRNGNSIRKIKILPRSNKLPRMEKNDREERVQCDAQEGLIIVAAGLATNFFLPRSSRSPAMTPPAAVCDDQHSVSTGI